VVKSAGKKTNGALVMNTRIHVNLSRSEIESESLLGYLSENGIRPELFLDGNEIEYISEDDLAMIGENLAKFDLLPITVHAPFEDLSPGSSDETIRNITLRKILAAVNIAGKIPVEGVVVHSGYNDWYFDFNVEKWLDRAAPVFARLCEEALSRKTRIFVENIFEKNPANLLSLKEKVGAENFGFCFDPGHAALFSDIPPASWVKQLGEQMGEIHLHDNCGTRDEHLPLLEGNINFRGILCTLKELGINPLFTLEPHTFEHAKRTLKNFRKLINEIYGAPCQEIL
jgi:sugar phosphate isomerase/epimerase